MEKNLKRMCIYSFAVHLKLTRYKSTILQLKKNLVTNSLVLSVVLIIKCHLQVTCLLTRFPLIKAHCHTA